MRASLILLVGILGLAAVFVAITRLAPPKPKPEFAPALAFTPANFNAIPAWPGDDHAAALSAFVRSCGRILASDAARPMGGDPAYGSIGDWRTPCRRAQELPPGDNAAIRSFFETSFQPFLAANNAEPSGLFTGYYEPSLEGSLIPQPDYPVPLLKRPADLVEVDLGEFRPHWKGERTAGRVIEGRLRPYEPRAKIIATAPAPEAVLAWVKNPVDAFFLQIQGSGRIELAEGGVLRAGFDGQNGHPYTAIGKTLIEQGFLSRATVSMQSIRAWLEANPSLADDIMNSNASYIYFRSIDVADASLGPLGAEGLPLTAGRSLAVDRSFHALGVPMWLETTLPASEAGAAEPLFRRLMIAQDTGGAIRGPVRGDVFFGSDEAAAEVAGRMKQTGRFYVLLPNAVAARLAAPAPGDGR